ncbi:MAG: CHAD domain-containing protein [Desulfuromonadaceae bacterium]|nr:CHAD domain-containing protein [Desulfuromonadaceae bacterium]MDD2848399.1 CHAD domain-containing protein [Desulfuromonadaceae bacterium]MDD4129972.1 CHAD domain-containing protein [Desulfuromonadaceae bacterium]
MAERSRGVVLEQWGELLRLRREVLKTFTTEASHDLRVSSRRFRAALELFDPWLPQKHTGRLKKSLREVTRLLGALRNIDEALLFFNKRTPAQVASGFQLSYLLTLMRSGERVRIGKTLKDFDHRHLNRTVQKAANTLRENLLTHNSLPIAACFSATDATLSQTITMLLPTAVSPGQHESRHALRIAIKKLRYFLEITAPVLKRDDSSTLELFKEYQTILGRMNDVAEFGILCSGLTLSRRERMFVETTLHAEEEHLLKKLAGLIEQKPLIPTAWSHTPQRDTSK